MSDDNQDNDEKKITNFHQMELDDRILKVSKGPYCALNLQAKCTIILFSIWSNDYFCVFSRQAVAKLGWLTPTLIQEKAIPLLLEGKDVLVRAKTGSGKTAAFAIPVIQKILNSKMNATEQVVAALILAPSKELCQQVSLGISSLL